MGSKSPSLGAIPGGFLNNRDDYSHYRNPSPESQNSGNPEGRNFRSSMSTPNVFTNLQRRAAPSPPRISRSRSRQVSRGRSPTHRRRNSASKSRERSPRRRRRSSTSPRRDKDRLCHSRDKYFRSETRSSSSNLDDKGPLNGVPSTQEECKKCSSGGNVHIDMYNFNIFMPPASGTPGGYATPNLQMLQDQIAEASKIAAGFGWKSRKVDAPNVRVNESPQSTEPDNIPETSSGVPGNNNLSTPQTALSPAQNPLESHIQFLPEPKSHISAETSARVPSMLSTAQREPGPGSPVTASTSHGPPSPSIQAPRIPEKLGLNVRKNEASKNSNNLPVNAILSKTLPSVANKLRKSVEQQAPQKLGVPKIAKSGQKMVNASLPRNDTGAGRIQNLVFAPARTPTKPRPLKTSTAVSQTPADQPGPSSKSVPFRPTGGTTTAQQGKGHAIKSDFVTQAPSELPPVMASANASSSSLIQGPSKACSLSQKSAGDKKLSGKIGKSKKPRQPRKLGSRNVNFTLPNTLRRKATVGINYNLDAMFDKEFCPDEKSDTNSAKSAKNGKYGAKGETKGQIGMSKRNNQKSLQEKCQRERKPGRPKKADTTGTKFGKNARICVSPKVKIDQNSKFGGQGGYVGNKCNLESNDETQVVGVGEESVVKNLIVKTEPADKIQVPFLFSIDNNGVECYSLE